MQERRDLHATNTWSSTLRLENRQTGDDPRNRNCERVGLAESSENREDGESEGLHLGAEESELRMFQKNWDIISRDDE